MTNTINMTGCPPLTGGATGTVYWLDVSATGSLASGPWSNVTVPSNQNGPDNGQQFANGAWGPLVDAGNNQQVDFPFCLEGVGTAGTGACCFQNGSCQQLTAAACLAATPEPGVFLGVGVECTPNPCQQPCVVDCTGATDEGETCGVQDNNGGCNATPTAFVQAGCQQSFCGTVWADNGTRDTDWYVMTLPDVFGTGNTNLRVTLTASEPTVCFILGTLNQAPDCLNLTAFASTNTSGCTAASTSQCLPANQDYYIFVSKGNAAGPIFDGYPCATMPNGNSAYRIDITCEPCPCAFSFCCKGDANGNGSANGLDVKPFVTALLDGDPNSPPCGPALCAMDCNNDGALSTADVNPFAAALIAGPDCTCACPAGAILENELCGFNTNGGCNSTPPVFELINSCAFTVCGTAWANNNTRDTDWYQFIVSDHGTPLTRITVTLKSKIPCGAILQTFACPGTTAGTVFSDDCISSSGSFCVPANSFHQIIVLTATPAAGIFTGFPCGGPEGNDYSLTLTCEACPPSPNDLCANAQVVTAPSVTPFSTVGANTELPEAGNCGLGTPTGGPQNDVWFSYTHTAPTGSVCASFCGIVPAYDGMIAVYNAPCGGITGNNEIACDDDTNCSVGGGPSAVTWTATQNQSYLIRVGGWGATPAGGAQGSGNLTMSLTNCSAGPAPLGDECSNPFTLTCGVPHVANIVAMALNVEPGEPDSTCEIASGGPFTQDASWWYSFTTSATATSVTISMCTTAATEDTVVTMFNAGGACGALTELACDDDFCTAPAFGPSQFTTAVTPNTTYLIRVERYTGGSAGGDPPYTIVATCTP